MKKIILYAYDCCNLGDDLFVRVIANRYPRTRFVFWSSRHNKHTFADVKNLKVIDKDSRLTHLMGNLHPSLLPRFRNWQEAHAAAVVYIGGSIFIEYESWPQVLNWWEYQARNHQLYVLGANFGPYHTEEYRSAMAKIFDSAQDVCFRETYSRDLFIDHKVRWAPDILFSCPMPQVKQTKRQIFLSVINCTAKNEGETMLAEYQAKYVQNLCVWCREYIQQGYTVVLASFCKKEGDEKTIADLQQAMPMELQSGKLQKLCYDGTNSGQILEAIAESEYVVASRFHAVILAIAAQRPVFPLVYSDKTVHVLEDIGFLGSYADLRKNEPISFERVNKNFTEKILVPLEKIKKQAENHFCMLDRQIKN